MNLVCISGRSGNKPEVKTTQGGTSVAQVSIASSERRKDKDGNWADHTEWHRVTVFGKTAENAAKFIDKGDSVTVQGKLSYRTTEKDGKKHTYTDVVADNIEWSKKGGQQDSRPSDDAIPF